MRISETPLDTSGRRLLSLVGHAALASPSPSRAAPTHDGVAAEQGRLDRVRAQGLARTDGRAR